MSKQNFDESLFDMFVFEMSQNIESIEKIFLESEQKKEYSNDALNKVFRIMHTIKGTAGMMLLGNISFVAHSAEDLFYYISEKNTGQFDYYSISKIIFECLGFFKHEMTRIKNGSGDIANGGEIIKKISDLLKKLKSDEFALKAEVNNNMAKHAHNILPGDYRYIYKFPVFFDKEDKIKSIRAFEIAHKLCESEDAAVLNPADAAGGDDSARVIRKKGLK